MRRIDLTKRKSREAWWNYEGVWWRGYVGADGKPHSESTGISHDVPYHRARAQRLLRQLEWLPDATGNLRCPECFGHALHNQGCELRAVLTSGASAAQPPPDAVAPSQAKEK